MTLRRLLAAALLSAALAAPAQAQAPLPSPAERAYVASRIYAAVETYFAHWDGAPDVDVDAAFRVYLDDAMAATDRRAFSLASQQFLASLGNAHTLFVDRGLMATPAGRPLGFSMRYLEGRWVVDASRVPGLNAGDVVAALDGQDMEAAYQDRRRYVSASTEQWARRVPFMHIPGFYTSAVLFPEAFTLTVADGRTVAVDRRTLPDEPEAAPASEGRWLVEGRDGYVRAPSFQHPAYEATALDLVDQFAGAEALVVDVRANGGGSTPSGLIEALMERPYRWWAESTPLTLALYRFYAEQGNGAYESFRRPHLAWPSRTTEPGATRFHGRLVLLVDGGCHSACEDFVMPFKDNGRATLVGETTAGSTGQPYMADLGDGMLVVVAAKREVFPDGSPFEGVGVRPDVEVVPRVEDVRTGRDPALLRALEVVQP